MRVAAPRRRRNGFDSRIGELGPRAPHVEVMRDQDHALDSGTAQDFGTAQRIFVRRARAILGPLHALAELALERSAHKLGFGFSSVYRSSADQDRQARQTSKD